MIHEDYYSTWKYGLTKLSEPSFDFYTDNLDQVKTLLSLYICKSCKKDTGDIFDLNLRSDCGAEFMFESYERDL